MQSELEFYGLPVIHSTDKILFSAATNRVPIAFIQDEWLSPKAVQFKSIKEAAKILQEQSFLWKNYSTQFYRRSSLIQENLKQAKDVILKFGSPLSSKKSGVWALISNDLLVYSLNTTCPLAGGEAVFEEDKRAPSRAYLKLWEALTIYQLPLQKSEICLELGASPGGWTYVLKDLAKRVYTIDRAPLDKGIADHPVIRHTLGNAFSLKPSDLPETPHWIFSDLICSPDRLLDIYHQWNQAGVKKFMMTLKFKGPPDFSIVEKFKNIPESKLVHLFNNKHELTFLKF